jgi:TPR repeat protein
MKKAFELYLKSAEGGYKLALNELGRCCYFGICTFKDEDKAFEFYLKTAEKCHSYSQYKVANYYNDRKHIPKNEEKGFY